MRKFAIVAGAMMVLALAACGAGEAPSPAIVHVYRDRVAFASEGLEPLIKKVQDRHMKTSGGRLIVIETADTLHLLPTKQSTPEAFELFLLRSEGEKQDAHAKIDNQQTIPWRDKSYIAGLASGLSGEKAEAAQKVLDAFIDETKHP